MAYIIYTSGTTGNPKGVMIEHKNVVTLIYWSQTVFPKEDFDIIYAATSYCFDISVYEMFLALSCGKKLRILQNAFKISDYAKVDKNILINTVPSVLLSISSEELFENVKILNLAGEALTYKHIRHVPLESLKLYNIYGPSEDTVYSTFFKVKRKAVTVPIGKPISNTQVYILDKYHHIVPIGVVGELYISGSGLARGYLNLEELTEDKFLNNPFVPGTKMYRTGDLGRWLPDGNIEYLGRIDHQVKIRGHRIELGEIDSYVLTYSADIKSVVTEVKEHGGDKILVVYYVSGSPIDKHDLSQYLAGKLPQYMLPGFYVELESIPLTNNGKIDRNNLPAVLSKDLIKNEYVAPVTVHQRILVEVCAQVLKYESISIKDNFYNLGGDSIKSIQIVSRLRQQGYSLKVEHILQYPVLEDLSRYITSEVVLIDQSAVTGTSILTPIQRYFFESEDIVNKSHYNQSVILKSIQRLSFSSLEASIKRLVEHHDALRMVYNNVEGIWTQFNADATSKHYSFEYFDLRTSASSKSEELESLQKIGENLQSNIDISSGILFNVGHVSMKDGDRIILVVHHLVIDGVSWRILLEDLGRLYESVVLGLSFDLPTKTDSFQNWGKALDEYSRSLELSKERLYWEGVESKQYDTIVTDYPVLGKTILENTLGFTLTSETTKLLQTRAGRKYNADINDVLLTGLGLALQDYFGVRTTKVLMEGHGREVMKTGLDLSRTIGWFTSVYPFSLDISDESQPSLVSVKESLRRIPNKGIGYGVLHYLQQEILSVSKASVLFNYLGDFNDIGAGDSGTEAITSSILSYSSEYIGSPVSRDNLLTDILLDVSGMTVNGEMSIHIRFSGKVFKESTIERLLSYYRTHLETMIKESEASSVVLTPSDLTYNRLPFTTLAEMSKDSEVEDIYELSPMQQGLYYHWLLDTNSSAYFMQTSYRIKSVDLDLSHVEEAFRILVNRYTILRTSFENRYWEVPLQIVHKNARVEFMHLQLESGYQLASIKNDDIHRGFNLGEPTQMRLMVVELLDDYYEFIWSHHHIIMDGWCLSILINDFSTILQSLQQENTLSLPEPEKYSSYIKWLSTVNRDSTLEYWRRYLDGLSSTNLIPFEKPKENIGYDLASHVSFINRATYKELVKFCQDLGVTLNTYVQAAWSYLLSSYNHSEDIIFGAVVSGRPPEVSGIESMVGLFINTIPIRVIFNSNDTPRSILNKVHEDSIKSTDHHYLSLAEIQLKRNLINHILIFENFLMSNDIANNSGSNKMTVEKSNLHLQTTYDFNFEILPTGQDMRILVDYNKNVFDDYSVANIVKTFEDILVFFKDNIDLPLHEAKEKLEKQSIYFKAVVQQNIKEIITSMDADFIKQKNSKKLSAFIKK
ncbi:condensation domain-containing protein [Chryseobacterium gambrini]|uniref:Condensation domain-containing protein n=1 Tax=Chryseobacterium gambrini TaxID=373672 RepID=A0AAJ1VPK6_9FLAO|nr:condensation domain-containing protein [Chryseobacterium gambrini]MDN4015109.1 condensation domain-containing protein [Chryseobacterium gambrini]